MNTLIVVPARYGSKRFPGKPLEKINGMSMLRRTANIAKITAAEIDSCNYTVATDDERIKSHCDSYNINCVMTSSDLNSGSDRALAACESIEIRDKTTFTHIVNLQGDAPFTPTKHIHAIVGALSKGAEVATPFIQMKWDDLDVLRRIKKNTAFSGTTLIKDKSDKAIWFSKTIIPAIRNETKLRQKAKVSPILRHIGLYGYTKTALEKFTQTTESAYEKLEGLEQLRFIENGVDIIVVQVQATKYSMQGIDTEKDIAFAEDLIKRYGDPHI